MTALSRRAFVRAGTFACASWFFRAKSGADFRLAQLRHGAVFDPHPEAIRRLLWEVGQRTSVEADLETSFVSAEDSKLFWTPFLYWSGSGIVSPFSDEGVRKLRRFFTFGGMMLIDCADADVTNAFDEGVRRELGRIFPREELTRVPRDHVLYKAFYLLDQEAGRIVKNPYLEGITLERRLAVVYSQNDLGGAWARDAFGRWTHEVVPGGDRQRELAYRLGVNIVLYALCLDYKEDLVHVPFILKRKR